MILAAGTTGTILATVAAFLAIVLLLVTLLLFVKQKLSPSGPVTITINGEKKIEVGSGSTLLTTLGDQKIFLPSACGGGGSCVQCECHVIDGGGEALPTETPHFTKKRVKVGNSFGMSGKSKTRHEYHHSRRSIWDKKMGCNRGKKLQRSLFYQGIRGGNSGRYGL